MPTRTPPTPTTRARTLPGRRRALGSALILGLAMVASLGGCSDTTTGVLSDGPAGARFVATSASGRRVATMAGQGEPVVVRDTQAWLAGDGSTLASVEPPSGTTTAVAFALDASGQRLAIAWANDDGSIRLAVHDGRSDWRRTAVPEIGTARGAMVAWRR